MQAMLSNAIGEQFSDKLRTWYDKFGEAMKDDGTLDNNERKELMDEYMGYVDEAMKLRDELAAATGYDKISQESTSQSASSKVSGNESRYRRRVERAVYSIADCRRRDKESEYYSISIT